MEKNNIPIPTLQFGSIQIPSVAYKTNRVITIRQKNAIASQKMVWESGVGRGWILDFIQYGLEPFLKNHGYHIGYSQSKTVAYCKAWAFSHVQAKQISPAATVRCMQCFHAGGEAELDWFLFHISHDDWIQLCYEWSSSEFLDNSDAGAAQQADLPFFAWNLLNLASSRAHGKFIQIMSDEYEDEEFGMYQATDESSAFGGDRRTL